MSSMATRKSRVSFNIRRTVNFLKLFLTNKRGLIGLLMIAFFAVLALGAQWLTPYNQLGYAGTDGKPISGSIAAPAWLRLLPPALGGRPSLSENLWVVKDKSFAGENWRYSDGGEWNASVSTGTEGVVSIARESLDNPDLLVSYVRDGSSQGNTTITIYKDFDFPYTGPPASGRELFNVSVSGTLHEEIKKQWNVTLRDYQMLPTNVSDVGARATLFVITSGGRRVNLWPTNETMIFDANGNAKIYGVWENVYSMLDVRLVFNSSGTYRFGCEVLLNDFYNKSHVELNVRISSIGLDLYGTSWGILGTSYYGYDLWAELVYGSRVSLYVGLISAGLAITIGLFVGLASGYLGKVFDEVMMRFSDVLLVLPGLPLLIVLFAVIGASIENLIILNGLLGWMGFAKLIRSQVLSIKERPYIEAAKAAGAGTGHILVKHVLPNVMGLVYVTLATAVPGAIVAEAALSWLGFYDWSRMSWGRMLEEMQAARAIDKWWWVVPPGLCIAAISVAFIMLGYALDEVLNPKLRVRR